MSLTYTSGDPLLTDAQVLAFGHNLRGRTELDTLQTALMQKYPTAFSAYTRMCRSGRIKAGEYFLWRESKPMLMFMVVRESSVGATRFRFVQSAVMAVAQQYRLEGTQSLAIAPLGTSLEWMEIKPTLNYWLGGLSLSVTAYD